MLERIKLFSKTRFYDYFILVSRFLLAIVFISYGSGKLTENQFGVSAEELATPIKDLSLFRVMCFLFDHEPFKSVVGLLQIICGLLLIYNRTVILGVLLFIPIAANILLMDISFMNQSMAQGFTMRFAFYFLLCLLILLHYRDRMIKIYTFAIKDVTTKFKHPFWVYLTLPIAALILEVSNVIPMLIYYFLTQREEAIKNMKYLWNSLVKVFEYYFN